NLVSMATHDMVWDWNVKTGEIYRSKEGWKIILNIKEDKAADGDGWGLEIHPEDRAKVKQMRDAIFLSRTKNLFEIECRILSDDNKYAFVQDRGYVIRDTEGNPIRLIGATQDITRRKDAEQKVLLSEKRFKSLVQSGSDLIAIIDEAGNYTYVSPTSMRILGYEPEFLTGKNAFSFIYPGDVNTIKNYLEKIKEYRSQDLPLYRFQNAKGQWRWLETNIINLLHDEAVNGIVANSRDITDRKLAEEKAAREKIIKQKEITDAIISAQENERSEIGRELHDNVNQLLGATRLYIDMARKNPENRDSYLESCSIYTLNAIDEIRKLSKTLITPMIKEIGLVESIKDLIEDIMQVHRVRIVFNDLNFEEENLNERFKLNLFRIVQEQINNTLKHAKAKTIEINFNQYSDSLSILIKDDGIGFDPSLSRKGVGINNIISRAELYKGSVEIDSAPNNGFRLAIIFNNLDLLIN
ncbi:MAG: PAS domain S-box protein, partial [Ginsengibacter sp.]